MKANAKRLENHLCGRFAHLKKNRYFAAGAVCGIFAAPGTVAGTAGNCAGVGAAGTACLVTGADAPSIKPDVFLEAV